MSLQTSIRQSPVDFRPPCPSHDKPAVSLNFLLLVPAFSYPNARQFRSLASGSSPAATPSLLTSRRTKQDLARYLGDTHLRPLALFVVWMAIHLRRLAALGAPHLLLKTRRLEKLNLLAAFAMGSAQSVCTCAADASAPRLVSVECHAAHLFDEMRL
ncbi:hypothetical protein NL676_001800 [Syzygium grande]|nr:hypothetical protein NL676_001800 [Syzygium grande]